MYVNKSFRTQEGWMGNQVVINTRNVPAVAEGAEAFDLLAQAVTYTVAASSARIYQQTFNAWRSWCIDHDQHLLDLTPEKVVAFLSSGDTTKATRQRQLSALRKLVGRMKDYALLQNDTEAARRAEGLGNLLADTKAPIPGRGTGKERDRRALSPAQADKLLRAWGANTPTAKRNHALIAVLLLGGIRRAEAVALRWREIDFENGVITVIHGKGDQRREVPLAGDAALDALLAWQAVQPAGWEYVFTPIRKGERLGADKPLSGTDAYRIVQATTALTGIVFKPHDLRRTYITESLSVGVPISEVQANAGHARGETTLRYAQTTNARERRKNLRLRYG
jgi:integrase